MSGVIRVGSNSRASDLETCPSTTIESTNYQDKYSLRNCCFFINPRRTVFRWPICTRRELLYQAATPRIPNGCYFQLKLRLRFFV